MTDASKENGNDGATGTPFWKSLFSCGDFEWAFQMRLGDAEPFFAKSEDGESWLKEKGSWLDKRPELFTAVAPEGGKLVDALWEQAVEWGQVSPPVDGNRDLTSLARQWEPDLLFLDHESMAFAAACVCMPSSWDPSRAVGKTLHEVHGEVSRLNSQIGGKIDRFLRQLKPGKSYCRENWGFTRSAELNYHPELRRRRLDETVTMKEIFLRVEQQIFMGVPGGVVMGLRIRRCPLSDLASDSSAWHAAGEKLRTMPDDVASYKGILSAREAMLREMEALDAE